MTVATYFELLERLRSVQSARELDAFADEVRAAYLGDPQLGDVLNSVRMTRSAFQIASRQ